MPDELDPIEMPAVRGARVISEEAITGAVLCWLRDHPDAAEDLVGQEVTA